MSTNVITKWNPGMMSSLRQDWATPQNLFNRLDQEFLFVLDAAASPANQKCATAYYDDALEKDWAKWGTVWCNPPFKDIGKWVEKAYHEAQRGCTVVLLIPARTDTRYFHDYCLRGEIRFIKGRLHYDDNHAGVATFPSMVVIFRGGA